jgi:hypothetical protein
LAVYASVVSRSLGVELFLGTPLRQAAGEVSGFWRGDGFDDRFVQALWRLLAEGGPDLTLMYDYQLTDDDPSTLRTLQQASDIDDISISYCEFLASWPTVVADYYLATPPPTGHPWHPPIPERHSRQGATRVVERFVDHAWRQADSAEPRSSVGPRPVSELDVAMEVLFILHDANPTLRRTGRPRPHVDDETRRRFRFWAYPAQMGSWRSPGPVGLIRWDSRIERGTPQGTRLYADGRWRWDDAPERNAMLGSDYGDDVSVEQARRIAKALGHHPDVVYANSVNRPIHSARQVEP